MIVDIYTILIVILILVSIYLIIKVVSLAIKLGVFVLLLLLIFSLINYLWIQRDISIIGTKNIVLGIRDPESNEFETAILLSENITKGFTSEELKDLNTYIKENKLDEYRKKNKILFIVWIDKDKIRDFLKNRIVYQYQSYQLSLSKNDILDLLESDNPFGDFASILADSLGIVGGAGYIENSLRELFNNDENLFKASLFISSIDTTKLELSNVKNIISIYKQGVLNIYPEYLVFKLAKVLPIEIFLPIVGKFVKLENINVTSMLIQNILG